MQGAFEKSVPNVVTQEQEHEVAKEKLPITRSRVKHYKWGTDYYLNRDLIHNSSSFETIYTISIRLL